MREPPSKKLRRDAAMLCRIAASTYPNGCALFVIVGRLHPRREGQEWPSDYGLTVCDLAERAVAVAYCASPDSYLVSPDCTYGEVYAYAERLILEGDVT